MAINPLSDIVLDVARAADPHSYRTSVEKLQTTHAPLPIKNFDEVSHSLMMEAMHPPVTVSEQTVQENPHRKFEAFMLQSFIMDMFSSDTSSVFGKGAGADFWKGLLVEKMADEMAQGGGIGVATLLDKQAETNEALSDGSFDEAAASVLINKNQINFMRYVSKGQQL